MTTKRSPVLLVAGLLVAVSGGIHLRLYRGGYRDISIDHVLKIWDSCSVFAPNALG